jgi:hypothetical protein
MAQQSLLEKELDELYKEVAAGEARGQAVGKYRRIAAYALKIIAAGGSLVVATGLLAPWHQLLGIAVLVAVFIDTVSSNHRRLIAEVEAGYAFRALRSRIKGDFNREASSLHLRRQQGDATVEGEFEKLMNEAHKALSNGIAEIRRTLEKADVEALQALSLDQERAGLSSK